MTTRQWYDGLTVTGTSFRQDALDRVLAGAPHVLAVAELHPEPSNPYDPDAVRVQVDGWHVGYIARQQTQYVHEAVWALSKSVLQVPVVVYRLKPSYTAAVGVGGIPAASEEQVSLIRRLASERFDDPTEFLTRQGQMDLFQASRLIDWLGNSQRAESVSAT